MIATFLKKLENLATEHSSISLYESASIKLIARCEGNIVGSIAPELKEIYKKTNGASILDYCLVGCKNHKLLDIAKNLDELWVSNEMLADDFVGFITNSMGENFGYLRNVKTKNGSHPVAYLHTLSSNGLIIIASSIGMFLNNFIDEVESTITNNPESLYIEHEGWQYNLNQLFINDPELLKLYQSGVFEKYYYNDNDLKAQISSVMEGNS